MNAANLLHAASTLAMTGVIWFVQVVHYPLFRFAEAGNFAAFSAAHQSRTTWVVMPLMLLELGTALLLVLRPPEGGRTLVLVGLALLGVIWLSTAFLQVPLHRQLSAGFDEQAAQALVKTNWVRTLCWSARSALALRLLTL